MNKPRYILMLIGFLFLPASAITFAQSDLSGTWEGILTVSPEAQIEVQFTLEQAADGSYSGVMNAPDQPSLTDVPIDSVSLQQNGLTMNVSAVSGVYEGTIAGDSIQGTWSQQGTSFDLQLTPYQEPVLSQQDFDRISGSWVGTMKPIPGGEMELTIIVRFEQNAEGEFVSTFSVPEQGGNNIPISSVELDGDDLSLEISQARIEINGTVSGEAFTGTFNQAGQSIALNLEKGEYEQSGLQLSVLNFARLQGPWHGQIGPLTVVLRVEESDGKYLAFLDSPDQGAADIPIAELEVQGDALTFAIAALPASYSAEIASDEITGQWTQGGQTQPLVLERGPYVPTVDISEQAKQQLAGSWQGVVNGTQLNFRFEIDGNGSFAAFLDIPSLGANGLPLSNMSLDEDSFAFAVGGIGAQFSGTLSAGELSGNWTREGSTNPLNLSKD